MPPQMLQDPCWDFWKSNRTNFVCCPPSLFLQLSEVCVLVLLKEERNLEYPVKQQKHFWCNGSLGKISSFQKKHSFRKQKETFFKIHSLKAQLFVTLLNVVKTFFPKLFNNKHCFFLKLQKYVPLAHSLRPINTSWSA